MGELCGSSNEAQAVERSGNSQLVAQKRSQTHPELISLELGQRFTDWIKKIPGIKIIVAVKLVK